MCVYVYVQEVGQGGVVSELSFLYLDGKLDRERTAMGEKVPGLSAGEFTQNKRGASVRSCMLGKGKRFFFQVFL